MAKTKASAKSKVKSAVKALTSRVTNKKPKGVKPGTIRGPYKKKSKSEPYTVEHEFKVDESGPYETIKIKKQLEQTEKNETTTNNNDSSDNISVTGDYSSISNRDTRQVPEVVNLVEQAHTVESGNNSNSDADLLDKFLNEKGIKPDEYKSDSKDNKNEDQNNRSDFNSNNNFSNPTQNQLISGAMLIALCDFIFPAVIIKLMTYANPKYKGIDKQKVKLTEDQKKDLEPAANIVAAYVFQTVNPIAAFFIAMAISYGSNITDALDSMNKEKEKESVLSFYKKEPVDELVNRLSVVKEKTEVKGKRKQK